MVVAEEIARIQGAKADIKTAIENKGVTVGNITLDNYAACIDAIPTGSKIAVVDMLLIGGGGGGGRSGNNSYYGGGGGAGAIKFFKKRALESGTYPIVVGAGGAQNVNGGDSCFDGEVALGGGAGGSTGAGCSGGSGGGAVSTGVPGSGLHKGGTGCARSACGWCWGGGGGGACGDGGNAYWTTTGCYMGGGVGGLGLCTCITGHYECFAGGGGGRGYCGGQGCYGGGNSTGMGAGCNASTCGSGGGGAPAGTASRCKAGCGAKGVLIIAYPSDCNYNITGANCSCVCNGICVHCFTSSGTLIVN